VLKREARTANAAQRGAWPDGRAQRSSTTAQVILQLLEPQIESLDLVAEC
jgi:hypothetical protein